MMLLFFDSMLFKDGIERQSEEIDSKRKSDLMLDSVAPRSSVCSITTLKLGGSSMFENAFQTKSPYVVCNVFVRKIKIEVHTKLMKEFDFGFGFFIWFFLSLLA